MPGHKIPEPYCWNEDFKVFYENLDAEHKGLFDGVFKCAENRGDAGALSALADAVKAHFATEEGMMSKAGYANLATHKKLHDDFVAKLGKLSTPLDDATIDFAKDWLVNHIMDNDMGYKGKL